MPSLTSCDFFKDLIPDSESLHDPHSYAELWDTVNVSVVSGEGYTVESSNPLAVKRGTDATFNITVLEGYEFDYASDNAIFSDGILTLSGVMFPTTIEIFLTKKAPTVDIIIPDTPSEPDTPLDPGDDPFDPGDDPFDPGDDPFDPGDDPFNPDDTPSAPDTPTVPDGPGDIPTTPDTPSAPDEPGNTPSAPDTPTVPGEPDDGECVHSDTDRDRRCDLCGEPFTEVCTSHTDEDKSKFCDYCYAPYIAECNDHIDRNLNGVCDYCNLKFAPDFVDTDLKATPEEGYKFICWTIEEPAIEGGELLSTEPEGTVAVPYGKEAYANYVEIGYDVILYRTNGGRVAESGADFYYQTVSNEHYYLPNTIHQNGTFERDGYVLIRYSENANGKGTYTTLGGNVEPTEHGFAELYLIWAKCTTEGLALQVNQREVEREIETEVEEGGETVTKTETVTVTETFAEITGYSGSSSSIVVPEYVSAVIGGETAKIKVERILAGAFANTDISTLVLPSTIREVEDGAFKGCTSLKTLYIHDNFYQINDAAFDGCVIPKIYLNAARLPAFTAGAEGMNAYKFDKIREATALGEKKIILFSGSSSLYGFFAEDMQKAFNNEYRVINFGNNAGVTSILYMEAFLSWYREGDIIIQAPETTAATQLGHKQVTYLTFRGTEGMFEIFSYVDMSEYKGFFSGLTVFNQEKRNNSKGIPYERISENINEYTDLTSTVDKPDYQSQSTTMNPYDPNAITPERIENLNEIYDSIKARGARVYMSWAPINKDACRAEALTESRHISFVKKVSESLHCTVISKPGDYMFEKKYFYNSDYHPGPTGARMRTAQLIADLKAQLGLENNEKGES